MTKQGERLSHEDVLLVHCLRAYGETVSGIAKFFLWSKHRTAKASVLFTHPRFGRPWQAAKEKMIGRYRSPVRHTPLAADSSA